MWIYTYLRADQKEIDMGPYSSYKAADASRKEHESFGALTDGPFEKPNDYKLYKGPHLD